MSNNDPLVEAALDVVLDIFGDQGQTTTHGERIVAALVPLIRAQVARESDAFAAKRGIDARDEGWDSPSYFDGIKATADAIREDRPWITTDRPPAAAATGGTATTTTCAATGAMATSPATVASARCPCRPRRRRMRHLLRCHPTYRPTDSCQPSR
jgi:hypothetical protein